MHHHWEFVMRRSRMQSKNLCRDCADCVISLIEAKLAQFSPCYLLSPLRHRWNSRLQLKEATILRQSSTRTWKLRQAAQALCIETEKALAFFQLRTLIRGHYYHCLTRSSLLLPLRFSHSGLFALRPSRPSAPLAESLSPASQDSFSFWTVLRLV